MFYPGLTEAGGLGSLYNREGTGTQSSSALPRTSEQRQSFFLARLPRKLPGAGSLSRGSARQPGRFVYLWALQNSVTSFWPLLPGAARPLVQGGHFLQTFVLLLPPRTAAPAPSPLSRSPSCCHSPAATVGRAPVGWCGADTSAPFDWFWTGTVLQDSSVLSLFPVSCCLGDEGVL